MLTDTHAGLTALRLGLCLSNRVGAGCLPGPISELASLLTCFLIEFLFVLVFVVVPFCILIFVKEGVFSLFSGVFFVFLECFCNTLTL